MVIYIKELISFTANLIDDDLDVQENRNEVSKKSFWESPQFYPIIGCLTALVALCLLQATCTIYRASRKKTPKVLSLLISLG